MATKPIYQVIRTWTNDDGWPIDDLTIEESFEDRAEAEAYLARHPSAANHLARIKTIQVQAAKSSSRSGA